MLKHAVHLDVIYIFAKFALDHLEFDVSDENKLTKCLAKCTSNAKGDAKTSAISKLMIAIKEKFTNLTDPLLRLVLKRPELLCREFMLEKLNAGDE